ncbi:hypothetical protein K457DRAFT_126054 [Linnemannia elongata AG-77]|uniref:Uncharacterized protein n=1 Tax=Linnemannia elongata AG-77 TaxID=1314771 RepID=A0A197JVK6_9FUNG|nr:hypothetical protein K457DRAFT_126054 [Linnemannia elongata AG-77]
MSPNPRNTCDRLGVHLVGGLFEGENSSLRVSNNARLELDEVVSSESGFVLETMTRLLQYWNVNGRRFDRMPENYTKARRITHLERSDLELTTLSRHSMLNTDFSLMLYDVGVVYGGLMFQASGLEDWEGAGVLLVDILYPDYWKSRPTYGDDWDAYEDAARKVATVPDRVVDLIKASTIYNSCTNAIERRSSIAGYPLGMHEAANALVYMSFESVGYGLAAIYDYVRDVHCETDEMGFDGTSLSGKLSIPRYCSKEQLTDCTTSGQWCIGVKTTAINVVKHMTGVAISCPGNVAVTAINDATIADYHRMAVSALYESSGEHVTDLCIEWANEIINSILIRNRTVRYVKRGCINIKYTTVVRGPNTRYSFSYYNSQGVDGKALKWYIKKRDAGDARTIKLIGVMYENGRDVKHG